MLTIKRNNYNFIFFDEIDQYKKSKFVLLRHDVDFDLDKAVRMAKFEHELGVKSTFFFLLNSDFYNIHHYNNAEKILSILELGNKISIHFDVGNYPKAKGQKILAHLSKEISFFQDLFKTKINIISFHRPDTNVLMEKIKINIDHTYMAKYSKKIKYLSDSMKKMPEGDLIDLISKKNYNKIQLLIHPFWWNNRNTNPQSDYENFIEYKLQSIKDEISNNSKIYKKKL